MKHSFINCLFLFSITCNAPVDADERIGPAAQDRVTVQGQTLCTSDGEPLRGTTFFVDLWDVPDMRANEAKYRAYFESIFEEYNLNCVRICPWIGRWQYDLAGNEHHRTEYLYMIDTVVRWCAENNVYAIVNLHIEYNTPVEIAKAKAAWDVLAPRYKDQAHVVYELVNEPEPKSSLTVMSELHEHVRAIAPNTHLILFSHVAATQFSEESIEAAFAGIDFANASVGFHCYDSVLASTQQWDRSDELRAAGYPMICTEFISLTNNNDMPIEFESLMHCMMRAEDRKLAWISWGPFAQYHNTNKAGWTHDAVRYRPEFREQMIVFGIDLEDGPTWPTEDEYRLQCVWGDGYLTNTSSDPWSKTAITSDGDDESTVWVLERTDGNIYRLKSKLGDNVYLHGDFTDEETWRDVTTSDSHPDWGSQKHQLRRAGDNVFHIKCLWGNLYLTGRDIADPTETATTVRTAPLNPEWTSQQWRLIPVTDK